jgi:ATP-dependent DNA ligase
VLGPDGLSRFEELRRREAARTAILYAFDLIERDGEDLRDHPFLERKAALARLLLDTEGGILVNEPAPSLDQGPQSRKPCGTAGEERDLESTSLGKSAVTERRLM